MVVLGSATPLREPAGGIIGAILVLSDITALSELDRGRRELFSMANHDLRTPLSSILVFVDLARRSVTEPKRLEDALAKIERAGQRMLRLTGDLLDAARFETGEVPIAPRDADLAVRVREAIARQSEPEKIEAQLPDGRILARFDEDRIDQILDNLLSNALKHTSPGTRVTVTLTVEGGNAQVRVRDRGAGIDPNERARLFAPFYQTPRGRSYGGTGLGLHISRRIAEAHGGRLWLEESGPDGSTFTLSLPA
jgi:signal transduction histidine kinase